MSFWKTVANTIGYQSNNTDQKVGALLDAQAERNRISIIGTGGAGKTTYATLLVKAAERKASKSKNTDYPFKVIVEEGNSNLYGDLAAIRAGHFPPKTGAFKTMNIEPGLTLEWQQLTLGGKMPLWTKRVNVPICDLAGEDIVQLIDKVKEVRTLQQAAASNVEKLMKFVNQSSGYIITIKATRGQGLGLETENEATSVKGMSEYSDANLARIVSSIIKYKHANPHSSPPIRGIAIVVTAWDALDPVAKQISAITGQRFDPTDVNISQESLEKFVYACFPSTHAAITSLGLRNTRYFPSYILTEKDSNGKEICWEGTNSPKIKRKEIFEPGTNWEDNVNTIYDSEFWSYQALDWLQEFATLG